MLIGACDITGAFTVGADVTLQGQGTSMSTLIASPMSTALTLQPGAGRTVVSDLAITSDAWSAISATAPSSGSVVLRNLELSIRRGVGIALAGPAQARLEEIHVQGSLSASNAPSEPAENLNLGNSPYAGIIVEATEAELANVVVAGFAFAGAAFTGSVVSWAGGESGETYQHGIYVRGGSASLDDVQVRNTLALGGYGYGLVSFDGSELVATRLTASQNQTYGVVQLSGATGTYTDLTAEDNGAVALWVQQTNALSIVGMNGFLAENTMSGVVIRDSSNVTISGLSVESTRTVPHVDGATVTEVGDGLQVFDSFQNLSMTNSRVAMNGRAGIVLEASDGSLPDGMFTEVTVSSTGGALGLIAQSSAAVIAAGGTWDEGVTREGDAATLDLTHSERVVTSQEIVGMNGLTTPPALRVQAMP